MNTALYDSVITWANITHALSEDDLAKTWVWRAHDEEGVRFAFFRTYEDLRTLATRLWSQRGASASTAHRALAQVHLAWRELQAVLFGVPDHLMDRAPKGEWPLRDILGHMFVVPRSFFVQTMHGLNEARAGKKISATFADDKYEEFLGHSWADYDTMMGGPLASILDNYATIHSRIIKELAGVSEAELDTATLWWEGYEVPVEFRLHRFDSHMRQHTIQIEKTLAWLDFPLTEARRLNRLIFSALAECEGALIGADGLADDLVKATAKEITGRVAEVRKALGV